MPAKQRRALNLPEILESIMLQLPQCDIYVSQGVSKFWKDTVAQSPQIQRKLFFKPARPNETIVWEGRSPWRKYSLHRAPTLS